MEKFLSISEIYLHCCDVGKTSKICITEKVNGVTSCENYTENTVLSGILPSLSRVTINRDPWEYVSKAKLFTGDDNSRSLTDLTAGNSTCNHSATIGCHLQKLWL